MTKKKAVKSKKKMGAPTKYTDTLPQELVDFFCVELTEKIGEGKNQIERAVRLPTVEGFCARQMISKSTFHIWVKKYKELSHALGIAKQWQMNHLMQHTLDGTYNASFARFLAENWSEYRANLGESGDMSVTVSIKKHDKDD